MKSCTRCHLEKPLDAFHKNPTNKDGRVGRCADCMAADYAEKPVYEVENDGTRECRCCHEIKPLTAYGRHRRHPQGRHPWCKECFKGWQPWTGRPRRTPMYKRSDPDYARNWALWRRFKLTRDQYDEMLAGQGGGCRFCGRTDEDNGRALSVDHDRTCCPGEYCCGECVRWVLCNRHNNGIGLFDDDVAVMRRAADMLEAWQANFTKSESSLPE